MATYNKFNAFVEDICEKVHNLASDQLTVGLTAAANAPVATNSDRTDLMEISYANLSSRNLTTSSSSQTSGTYTLVLNDLVLTASGAVATFRYVFIYNDDALNDDLICWYDHGSDVTLAASETYTIDFTGPELFSLA